MGAHPVGMLLFVAAFGLYLIGLAADAAGESKTGCEADDDNLSDDQQDAAEARCGGFAAGALFYMLGFVACCGAAVVYATEKMRTVAFLVALFFFSLGNASETGSTSRQECIQNEDDESVCQGDGGASAFWVFASFAFVAVAVLALQGATPTDRGMATGLFFVTLALVSIARMSDVGGDANQACQSDDDFLGEDGEVNDTRCDGFGFTAFLYAVALVSTLPFAYLAFTNLSIKNLWLGYDTWWLIVLVAVLSENATNAQVWCEHVEDDQIENKDQLCSGFASAAFWATLGAVGALAALVLAYLSKDQFMYVAFGTSWVFFYLSETSRLGGTASFFCETEEDFEDDDLVASDDDQLETQCDSDATGTFFFALAFVAMAVGAVFLFWSTPDDAAPPAGTAESAGDKGTVPAAQAYPEEEPTAMPVKEEASAPPPTS